MDVMGGIGIETGGESAGFTFANILQWVYLLPKNVLEGVVDTSDLPLC